MTGASARKGVIKLQGHSIRARSIGGLETCIDLPTMGLAFDIGRCPAWAVGRPELLFTHAHVDHLGGVVAHAASRALVGMRAPTYVLPAHAVQPLGRVFDAWRELDGANLPHRAVPLVPGDTWISQKGFVVRPFATCHTTPSQGYQIWKRKNKLKAEYEGLSQAKIRDLRVDEDVEVSASIEEPLLAFTGDTTIEALEWNEELRKVPLLIHEVTFLDDRVTPAESAAMGHTHLDDVIRRASLFENESILFTHFSARYKAREIVAILDDRLPPSLRERVTPLISGH